MADRSTIDDLCRHLADEGKLIEAGWVAFRALTMSPAASQAQVDEMRSAFFAGAQHLFYSIMGILDPGAEPTESDLSRMTMIDVELRSFVEEFKARIASLRDN